MRFLIALVLVAGVAGIAGALAGENYGVKFVLFAIGVVALGVAARYRSRRQHT